ncbi:recombinase RecT (plasmid) [Providencia rettgeri]|uniref:P33 n=1 Tax=Providencia rettgeri TaxID=587 RepID=A0A379FT93_PRORE|nr:recombinase RecT [Providencia rettgeri]QXB07882.1 recombinase RecT [Providencia rettgeri]SUC31990.1 P33 [Providencia rettgeri]
MSNELQVMSNVYNNLQTVLIEQGIESLLPAQVTTEQFIRTAATAMIENPDLQAADKKSLVLALTRCAKDGLMPDGREAALVVRNTKVDGSYIKKAVYMPMVDGVMKRARQSGQVANIVSKVVYASDEFEYVIDEFGEHLKHKPAFVDNDEIVKVYSFARLTSGEMVIEVMSRNEIERVRDIATSGKINSVWDKWFDRMALKTVIHRLARRLPCASELFSLFEVTQDASSQLKTVTEPQIEKKRLSLREALTQRASKLKGVEIVVSAPEPEIASIEVEKKEAEQQTPQLESLLNALDDATEQENLNEIVQYCTEVSVDLSEYEKQILRNKIKSAKNRLQSKSKIEPIKIVRYANSTKNSWRFPDGSVAYDFLSADRKAKELGMQLESGSQYRFSNSH